MRSAAHPRAFGLAPAIVCALSITLAAAPERSAVADAAMAGDAAAVRALLKQGADVNASQGDGMTALHWAVMHGDTSLTRTLLTAGAKVTAATRLDAYTPLLVAAMNGSAEEVAILLEAGASCLAATSNGATALMLAAGSGNADAVKRLLDGGADPNATERARGETALMFAAARNRAPVIAMLAARGADVRATTRVVDLSKIEGPRQVLNADRQDTNRQLVGTQGGLTALHFAARQGYREAADALLDAKADVNQVSAADGTSALLIATINGHFDLAMALLARGADPRLASAAGATPLYAAVNVQWIPRSFYPQPTVQSQQQTTYLELMTALLEHGADPDVRLSKKLWYTGYNFDLSGVAETGATPFWRAAQATDVAAMRLLVEWGADPAIPTAETERRRGRSNADVERPATVPGGRGADPTSTAQPSFAPAVNALQAAAGDGWFGNFHVNAPGGWMPSVRYLVEELGFDVNAADFKGYTPLHYAAARGDNEMIRYLVAKGANVKSVSKDGVTTADMANGHDPRVQPFLETVALLEELGSENNHQCLSCGRTSDAARPKK